MVVPSEIARSTSAKSRLEDLAAALKWIDEVAVPYEVAQVRARMGVDTILAKILVIEAEWQPGRTSVVLVREPVGIGRARS